MFGHSDLQWFPWITMGQLCLLTNALLRHWVKGMCSMMDMLILSHFGIKDLEFSNLNKSWVLFSISTTYSTNQLSIRFPLSTTSCKLTYIPATRVFDTWQIHEFPWSRHANLTHVLVHLWLYSVGSSHHLSSGKYYAKAFQTEMGIKHPAHFFHSFPV
jgi:hypothetical protein